MDFDFIFKDYMMPDRNVDYVPLSPGRSTNILVLDDDPIFCSMLKKIARANGIFVTSTRPNREIGHLPVDGYFDLIVVDYDLGDIDGLQIARLFRETPILLISGKMRRWQDEIAQPISVVNFMHKNKGPKKILAEALRITSSIHP